MIRDFDLIYVYNDHLVADDIMTEIIDIVDYHIVAKVATDDGAVVKTNRCPDVMEFQIIRFEFANTHQTKKLAKLNQGSVKPVCN